MDSVVKPGRGETVAHAQLKRAAVLWAQAKGFSACAVEVSLPQSRYRADVAAYRPGRDGNDCTAIFECKQALPDLRRDNCCVSSTRTRLEAVFRRRLVLEKHFRIHYPNLRVSDSLFPEFDSHDFATISHKSYTRVVRELQTLQRRLKLCTKLETLLRYRSANLFFIVVPEPLFRPAEIPVGWGALIDGSGSLRVTQEPAFHENKQHQRIRLLERIAGAGTRRLNAQLGITYEELSAEQQRTSANGDTIARQRSV